MFFEDAVLHAHHVHNDLIFVPPVFRRSYQIQNRSSGGVSSFPLTAGVPPIKNLDLHPITSVIIQMWLQPKCGGRDASGDDQDAPLLSWEFVFHVVCRVEPKYESRRCRRVRAPNGKQSVLKDRETAAHCSAYSGNSPACGDAAYLRLLDNRAAFDMAPVSDSGSLGHCARDPSCSDKGRADNLRPETLKAWEEYVEEADGQMQERLNPDHPFLFSDEAPGRAAKLRNGEIVVSSAGPYIPKRVPSGLIHDWNRRGLYPERDTPRRSASRPRLRAVQRLLPPGCNRFESHFHWRIGRPVFHVADEQIGRLEDCAR